MSLDSIIGGLNLACNLVIVGGMFYAWNEYKRLTTVPEMRSLSAKELDILGFDDL